MVAPSCPRACSLPCFAEQLVALSQLCPPHPKIEDPQTKPCYIVQVEGRLPPKYPALHINQAGTALQTERNEAEVLFARERILLMAGEG